MSLKLVHYVQGGLAILAGSALAVAQAYPQLSTPAHLIAGVAGIVLANLGILSGSAATS